MQDFQAGKEPRTAEQISESLGIPIRLVRQTLSELTEARVLSEVRTEQEKTPAYQPARSVEALTVGEVIALLDRSGIDKIPYVEAPEWGKLAQRLALFGEKIRESAVDIALKDL